MKVLSEDLNNCLKFHSQIVVSDEEAHPYGQTHFIVELDVFRPTPDEYHVSILLKDPNRKKIVLQDTFIHKIHPPFSLDKTRAIAHTIAQKVLKSTHGLEGMFTCKIAGVKKLSRTSYYLCIADYDGYNPHILVRSANIILDPKCSPCGRYIMFRTLNRRYGQKIWVYNLQTNSSRCITDEVSKLRHHNIFGRNISSANFGLTPQQIIFARSGGQSTNIYKYDLASKRLSHETDKIKYAIQTCPVVSSYGDMLFTSDADGAESVYVKQDGYTKRLDLKASFMGRVCFSQPSTCGNKLVCSIRGKDEGSGYTGILFVDDYKDANKVNSARVITTVPKPGFIEHPKLKGNFVLCQNTYSNHVNLMWVPADAQNNEAYVIPHSFIEADIFP